MAVLERKIIHDRITLCSHILYPRFVLPRHKHPEYEIMLFTQGSGKQFVGEGMADFKEGDIALIGSNVPHLHLCHAKLHPDEGCEPSAGEALQFLPSVFPRNMEQLPDYEHIYSLLQRSQYGLRFYDLTLYARLRDAFRDMDGRQNTERLIGLMQILEELYRCGQVQLLSSTAYSRSNLREEMNEPVNKVYAYLFNHFKDKVTLPEVADYVRLNPASLCRYFKQRTDKSIFQCLAEIRIEHACKLLAYSNLSVSQIAYESGYNHVPYFIKQFEEQTRRTPKMYRMELNKI
ncbi:MAG: AraC family transcriptional regulator [Paraprevotella sp.]|nr:AraC family transcriptional regulator [Paraprevotella sp.]